MYPSPRPLKSVAGTFHGKRAGFISPIYFPRRNGRPSGILHGPTRGPGGGTFRPVCSRISAAPADFFRGRIKKSPAIRLNCGASRNLNTSFCCGEGGIRTRGTLTSTHDFQSCSFDQLGHLSNLDASFDCEKSGGPPSTSSVAMHGKNFGFFHGIVPRGRPLSDGRDG